MRYKLLEAGDVLANNITKRNVNLCSSNTRITTSMARHLDGRYILAFETSIEQLEKNVQNRVHDAETVRYYANSVVNKKLLLPNRSIAYIEKYGDYVKAVDTAILAAQIGYRLGLADINVNELVDVVFAHIAGTEITKEYAYLTIAKICCDYYDMIEDGIIPAVAKQTILANDEYPNGLKNLFAIIVVPYYKGQRITVANYGETVVIRLVEGNEYEPVVKFYAPNGLGFVVQNAEIIAADDLSRTIKVV